MRSEFFGRVHFLSHTLSICLSLFFSASSVFIILVMTRAGDAFLFLFWLLLCWLRRRRRRRPPPFHFNDFFFGWVIFTFLLIWLIFIFSFFLSFFLSVSLFFISVLSLLPHFIESFFLSFFIFFSLLVYVFGSWINGELPTLWWDDFRSRWALIDSSNLGTAPLSKENNPSSTLSASFSSPPPPTLPSFPPPCWVLLCKAFYYSILTFFFNEILFSSFFFFSFWFLKHVFLLPSCSRIWWIRAVWDGEERQWKQTTWVVLSCFVRIYCMNAHSYVSSRLVEVVLNCLHLHLISNDSNEWSNVLCLSRNISCFIRLSHDDDGTMMLSTLGESNMTSFDL